MSYEQGDWLQSIMDLGEISRVEDRKCLLTFIREYGLPYLFTPKKQEDFQPNDIAMWKWAGWILMMDCTPSGVPLWRTRRTLSLDFISALDCVVKDWGRADGDECWAENRKEE